ncbi:hypothetical protein K443DRAFT_680201 [Laccaria amethystina LaAM-08-1]|uniref:Uncharacterized protein n=1 Tax=Laccaria amethystina LaAM-08-1 TaxID=1095629 RepID=A0A0C9X261_9AGAR|nr:hypothetical protein K443DRAFT_680201 [Laccaria amethystina LaAM-08-1]
MFESIITVSLYPYAWAMAKCQPQSIEKEVIPFSAVPRHLLRSHYPHPRPLKNSKMSSSILPSTSSPISSGSSTPVSLDTRVGRLENRMGAVEADLKEIHGMIRNLQLLSGVMAVTLGYVVYSLHSLRR